MWEYTKYIKLQAKSNTNIWIYTLKSNQAIFFSINAESEETKAE